jgi:dihydroorotate dehydrogenase
MKSIYQNLVKPLAFQLDAEKAHHATMDGFALLAKIPGISSSLQAQLSAVDAQRLEKKVFGLTFKNPVGLAAGFDKDGKYYELMELLGFGFIEIGTVTPKAQQGNPKPRLFRLPKDQALINRMGFNNDGVKALKTRLKHRKASDTLLGANIGKNKVTPNERAAEDYSICFQELYAHVDYFVVNVSSPNTPGLRDLQEKGPLTQLLMELLDLRSQESTPKPILLKIAPDLSPTQITDIVDIVKETKIEGLIVSNTTIERSQLNTTQAALQQMGSGGLSGKPLFSTSNQLLQQFSHQLPKGYPLIGVGGIANPADALEKLNHGAQLIQVYTGLVYYGPTLIKDTLQYLAKNL